ncbi:MAG: DMT family transporter [Candidatus Nanopelagicales bacterium]|nr:DMT family transporter [Candidatus Nanopelagicales bacterium]
MPVILALLSSLVWGLSDFLGGTLSKKRKAVAVIGGSQSFGLIFVSLLAIAFQTWTWNQSVWINGAIAGAMGLFGLVCFYTALATGQMGIVAPISSLSAVVPVTIGLVQGEQPSTMQLAGIVVALIGVILASGPELNGKVDPRPVLLALSAAVTFGFCVYFMARGARINPTMTVTAMRAVQVLLVIVLFLAIRNLGGLVKRDIPMLATIGASDAGANVLYTFAASLGLLSVVSVLGSLYPIVTVLLAWWIHKERLMRVQYIGIAITFSGVALLALGQ